MCQFSCKRITDLIHAFFYQISTMVVSVINSKRTHQRCRHGSRNFFLDIVKRNVYICSNLYIFNELSNLPYSLKSGVYLNKISTQNAFSKIVMILICYIHTNY